MNVLITGVAGFLGSHLADACLDRGWQVTGLDNLFRGRPEHMPEHPAFRFETLDLCTDVEAIAALIKETRPDLILHYGAINGTEYFYERPWSVLDTNVSSTVQLLKAIEASGHAPDRLAYASSSEVYGESPDRIPTDERCLTKLDIHSIRDSYAAAKAIGDFYVRMFCEQHDIDWTLLRIFNGYGPRMDASKFGQVVPEFIHRALSNEPFTIIGDGSQTRSFCHVDDHVRMVLALAMDPRGVGVYNIGNDEEVTMMELARTIHEVLDLPFEVVHLPPRPNDPVRRVPDCSSTWAITGPCEIDLRAGIAKTATWYRDRLSEP